MSTSLPNTWFSLLLGWPWSECHLYIGRLRILSALSEGHSHEIDLTALCARYGEVFFLSFPALLTFLFLQAPTSRDTPFGGFGLMVTKLDPRFTDPLIAWACMEFLSNTIFFPVPPWWISRGSMGLGRVRDCSNTCRLRDLDSLIILFRTFPEFGWIWYASTNHSTLYFCTGQQHS